MSFTIFGLWATLGLAALAASIPVIVHLLHRQRTQPILWGAMMFLKESPLQQKRRKKVDHWLLMLLRIAVIVLLVLFVAWPRQDKSWSLLGTGGTDIAVVIDHSLSAGRHSGNSTVFQQGVSALENLAASKSLRASDTVAVVLAEQTPRKLTDRPVPADGLAPIVADLKKMPPGASAARIPDAVQAAREVLARGRNAKKVVIVLSDRQRSGWRVNDLTAWNAAVGQRARNADPDMQVWEVPVTPEANAGNVGVTDLQVSPPLLGTTRAATVTATVTNTGPKEVPAHAAKLFVTGKQVAQQPVGVLPPGESRTIRFDHTFTEYNSNWVEVQLDAADGLAADNRAVASAYVWQSLPVLVIDGQLTNVGPDSTASLATFRTFKNARFLLNAMLSDAANPDAPPLVKPTIVSVADPRLNELPASSSRRGRDDKKAAPDKQAIALEDYAAVVLNDVPQIPTALQNRLADYARAGHGVWVILGRNASRGLVEDGLAQAGLMQVKLADEQKAVEKAPALDVRDANNPMLQLLVGPDHNALAGVETFRWWSLRPRDGDGKVVVAAAGSNDPLIVDRPLGNNGGRVVLWTTSVDRAWNNWPAVPTFPPLVNVTVNHLAAGRTKGMENKRVESGDAIQWVGPATPAVTKVEVIRPDGTKAEARPVVRDGRQVLTYKDTHLPGKYELRFDQSAIPQPVYYGVGINRGELDETALSPDDVAWLSSADHKFVQGQLDLGQGLAAALTGGSRDDRWMWLALASVLIAILLFETFMTYRMMQRQTKPGADTIPGAMPAGAPSVA